MKKKRFVREKNRGYKCDKPDNNNDKVGEERMRKRGY